MAAYDKFAKEALSKYKTMPEETSELYKKNFIKLPSLKEEAVQGISEHKELTETMRKNYGVIGIDFDAVIGGGDAYSTNEEFIRVKDVGALSGEFLRQKLYGNSEDRYVSYIHAFSKNAMLIKVPKAQSASLAVLMFNSEAPLNTQITVDVGDGAKLELLEVCASSAGADSSFGVLNEVRVGKNSHAEINVLHNESANTTVMSFFKTFADEDAVIKFNSLYSGGMQVRVRNIMEASGTGSRVEANEIVIGTDAQKFDLGTSAVNAAEKTTASVESKAVLLGEATGIIKGFAKLNHGAKKSNSFILERGLLFDNGAKIDCMPDMSVEENDVRATHSSATTPLDSNALFYVMSRGINEPMAKRLLALGFFDSIISKIGSESMREIAAAMVRDKIDRKQPGNIPELGEEYREGSKSEDFFKGHYKYRQ